MNARPTPYALRVLRALRLIWVFAWIGLGALVVYPKVDAAARARLKQRWSRNLLDVLGVHVHFDVDAGGANEANAGPAGRLIVANHVSWLDIFVINAVCPAAFIAKAEIRRWPFIGWLAERNDTIFLRRGSHGHARVVNEQIDATLNAGIDVAVFPEGTTTDGTHLLGFHAALLQPAIETGRAIWPLALSYHDAHGQRSLAPSFAGDTTLAQCLAAILACRTLTARVRPAPPLNPAGQARRELSRAAHASIATRLGFHLAHTAPERSSGPLDG